MITRKHGGYFGLGQTPDLQPHTPRSHGREERARNCRREDEDGAGRRLLERLQERVLRRLLAVLHRVGIAKDDDATLAFEGPIPRLLQNGPNRLDFDFRGIVRLDGQ